MRLAMLGGNGYYQYGYAPVNGAYVRNTRGYLGQSSMTDLTNSLNVSAKEVLDSKDTSRSSSGWNNFLSSLERLVDVGGSVVDTINTAKSGATPTERAFLNDLENKSLTMTDAQFKQYLAAQKQQTSMAELTPWLVGGGAVLVGLLLIAGTRKRRR